MKGKSMKLHTKYIIDKNGKPISVVLPIEEFRKLIEVYGIDLSKEEIESIEKNKILRASSATSIEEEYTDLDDL
jgi:hypothetical protein